MKYQFRLTADGAGMVRVRPAPAGGAGALTVSEGGLAITT